MSTLAQMEGYSNALKLVSEHLSPRAQKLANLERYVEGTQYAGRPDFFDRSVPLWHRAPCVVYPIGANVIASNTDLVFGESRWPRVTSRPSEDDSSFDDGGLDQKSSALLDKFICEIERHARLKPAMREAFTAAQSCGTAVCMFGVREGELFIDSTKARWCEPEFDASGRVKKLVIKYPYFATKRERQHWRVIPMMYRREIDDVKDVVFRSAVITAGYHDPDWAVETVYKHELGFCPVVWYPFMRGVSTVGDYDGRAVHENMLDKLTALDFALSMKHRAALYSGDPQWTEVGVEPGYVPSSLGDIVTVPATAMGGEITSQNRPTGQYRGPQQPGQGRKKGPGEVWQYESPDVKVQLHTLPGDALTSLENHCADLRSKLAECMSAVFLDPDTVRFASSLSGKALAAIRQRQLDRCEQYRDDVAAKLLLPSLQMLLRVCYVMGSRNQLSVHGLSKVLPILSKSHVETA